MDELIATRGIVGYHGFDVGGLRRSFRRDYGVKHVLTVDATARPPNWRSVWMWFGPVFAGFFLGAYLLLRWLWLLKTQFFTLPADFPQYERPSTEDDEMSRRAWKAWQKERKRKRVSRQ